MNKLFLAFSALRHPAGRPDGGVAVAPIATVSPLTGRRAEGHDHRLACAWGIDPATGRLGCVWWES